MGAEDGKTGQVEAFVRSRVEAKPVAKLDDGLTYEQWQLKVKEQAALIAEEERKRKQELANQRTEEAIAQNLLDKANEIMLAMTPDKMEDSTLRELTASFGIIYDKLRLARGQSTANINVNNLSGMISQVSSREVKETFIDAEVKAVELNDTGGVDDPQDK